MNYSCHLMLGIYLLFTVSSEPWASGAIADPVSPDMAGIQMEEDIVYVEGTSAQKLDLYRSVMLQKGKRYPAIVIIHGGGWAGGTKGDGREQNFATNLARAGYICASIDYSLATKDGHTWPEVLYQCKCAVQFLRKHAKTYQIDPHHMGALGGSAGGHLALMVGLTSAMGALEPAGPYKGVSSRLQAVVDFYGPTDLPTLGLDQYCGMMLGVDRTEGRSKWIQASPVNYVSTAAPPVLIVHGTKDTLVPVSQSDELIEKLKNKGVPHEIILVNGAGHSFDLNPPQQDLRPAVIDYFDRYLKGKK